VLELPLVAEARRQLDICNACRYCEGLCAVFPALERRSFFNEGDITYLASLCHDCRSCFDVCPFAPPHELAVDIPRVLSTVRERTHAGYAWPGWLASRVDRRLSWAFALSALAVLFLVAATIVGSGVERLFAVHSAPGSFYEVVPWLAMMIPFMGLSLVAIAVMLRAAIRFWRDTDSPQARGPLWELGSFVVAIRDAATLRYLRGGGPGCTYADERPNMRRRILHSLVFYGFIAAFIATVAAALIQDVFGILPPYPFWSVPVVLGSVGGAAMIAGCIGLLMLKTSADPERIAPRLRTMDVAFLVVLIAVNVSGFTVLLLRETAAMGITLNIHLGLVAALYLSMPYGKFAHAVYRSLALLRNGSEVRHELAAEGSQPAKA
jgi:citrate/tricarballylate utilization protein